jgi:hypothetical protein
MELLLNLIWVALVIGSFLAFIRRQAQSSRMEARYWQSLLALACVLLLLFPIISASDDLHPSQTLMEEATKRVQHLPCPLQFSTGFAPHMLPTLLLLGLLLALVNLQPRILFESKICLLDGHGLSPDGRAPPFRCN